MFRSVVIGLVSLTLVACAADAEDVTSDGSSAASRSSEITLANWKTHPEIRAIESIAAEIASARLTSAKRENLCDWVGDSSREKLTDGKGAVRKLVLEGCGEEHCAKDSFYYDASNRLRLATRDVGFVSGAAEQRAYFDATGKKIWHVSRSAYDPDANPAYGTDLTNVPFVVTSSTDPDALEVTPEVSKRPAEAYAAPAMCEPGVESGQ